MAKRRSSLAAAAAFAIFSVGLVGFGSHLLLGERAFRARAAHLSGRIVAVVCQAGDDQDSGVYCPKVAFNRSPAPRWRP